MIVLVATVGAYHYSLLTLLRGLGLDSPLAYLGLVPLFALLLALIRSLGPRAHAEIYDRLTDYVIGIPLLLVAVLIVAIVPVYESTFFWLWRLDLVSMPLFVAGAVAVTFGAPILSRMKLPICFLFLAWPVPYTALLPKVTQTFTNATTGAVNAVISVTGSAQQVSGFDGSVFAVTHGPSTFLVSIASACSGVNGVIGFLIVGIALALLVRGPILLEAIWLMVGTVLIWLLNLLRIVTILAVGRWLGEGAAIDWLHPFIGLITFSMAVTAMVLGLSIFHLTIPRASRTESSATREELPVYGKPPRHIMSGLVALAIVTGIGSLANMQLPQFALLAEDLGSPRIGLLSEAKAQIPGWSLYQADSYPWVRQYFGRDANWVRFAYQFNGGGTSAPSDFRSTVPVVMDVISTSDLGTFSTFGLEACYSAHDYQVLDERAVALEGGLVGHSVVYRNPQLGNYWLAVYWEWPVVTKEGERYERVVLNMTGVAKDQVHSPASFTANANSPERALAGWLGVAAHSPLSPDLSSARDFMIGFADRVVIAITLGQQTVGAGGAA